MWVDTPQCSWIYICTHLLMSLPANTHAPYTFHACGQTCAPLHTQRLPHIHLTQACTNSLIDTHIFCIYILTHAHIHTLLGTCLHMHIQSSSFLHTTHTHTYVHSYMLTYRSADKLAVCTHVHTAHLSSFIHAYSHMPTHTSLHVSTYTLMPTCNHASKLCTY